MSSKSIVLKAEPGIIRITPLGFHHYASEYFKTAEDFSIKQKFSPVPYFLYCRAIELVLKAFLLSRGVPIGDLWKRSLSHNLVNVFEKTKALGIEKHVKVQPAFINELKNANEYYNSKGFEYFQIINAMKGYSKLPDINVLRKYCSELLINLEKICLEAD